MEGDMSSRWLNMPSLRTMTLLVVAPEGSAQRAGKAFGQVVTFPKLLVAPGRVTGMFLSEK